MPTEQKTTIRIDRIIIINGTHYEVKVVPALTDPFNPDITSVEHQLLLIPVPEDATNAVDRLG